MRVIAGKVKGVKLISPKGLETRPTSDRIKESLFNIIAPDLYDSCFLDLFSGSGGIGIEALSRNAKEVVFVEESKKAAKIITRNTEKTKLNDLSTLLNTSTALALNQLKRENKKFDIIFMDPPYYADIINDTIKLIIEKDLLLSKGSLIIEREPLYKINDYKELSLWKEKEYNSSTTISFYERK